MRSVKAYFRRHQSGSILAGLLIISLMLLLLTSDTLIGDPKKVGFSVFSTLQNAVHSVGSFFTDTVNSIQELRKLREEYDQMREKIGEYQKMEREYISLQEENVRLREQPEFSDKLDFSHVPAEIIAKDPGNLFKTFVINKGSIHDITKNMPVIAFQDGFQGLVGRVITVGLSTSTVLPLFSSDCHVAGRLLDSRYDGLVNGTGRQLLKMEFIKKRAKSLIHYGDLVVTSGLSSLYPPNIYIGRVRDISAPDWMSSLELELEPVIDFGRLEYVYILNTESE